MDWYPDEHDQGEIPGDTIIIDKQVRNPATIPSPCRSSPGESQPDSLDLSQSAHIQLIHEAQAAVTALYCIEAQDQTASLPSSPDARARARAMDRQDIPVNTVGQLVDGRSAATADRAERSSTLVSVRDLLTSDASPPVHQATSTCMPGTGQIPRQPGDAEL